MNDSVKDIAQKELLADAERRKVNAVKAALVAVSRAAAALAAATEGLEKEDRRPLTDYMQ